MRNNQRGLLDALREAESKSQSKAKNRGDYSWVEVEDSGDYLAFLEEGDPVYVPRAMVEWTRERRDERESFLAKLTKPFRKN